jgi:hypothetical protein
VKTFKLVVAWILLVISAVGVIGALAGVVGSWVVRNQVTEATVNLLTAGETAVITANQGVTRIDDRLGFSQQTITTLENEIVNAGTTVAGTSLVGVVVDNALSEETANALGEARATAVTIAETLFALEEAIQAANRLPFVTLDGFAPNLVVEAADGIRQLEASMTTFRATVQERREALVDTSVGVLTGLTADISGRIETVQTTLNAVDTQLGQTADQLAAAKISLPRTFTLIALAASVAFLFIGLAFASLLLHSWAFTQNPDLTLAELIAARRS